MNGWATKDLQPHFSTVAINHDSGFVPVVVPRFKPDHVSPILIGQSPAKNLCGFLVDNLRIHRKDVTLSLSTPDEVRITVSCSNVHSCFDRFDRLRAGQLGMTWALYSAASADR